MKSRCTRDRAQQFLIEVIDGMLRQRKNGSSLAPSRRRRMDKVHFYLQVYDRAEACETFPAIARGVGKRVSTVKSAFLAAGRMIKGLTVPGDGDGTRHQSLGRGKAQVPTKRDLVLGSINTEKHVLRCPQCRSAKTPKEMCAPAQKYVEQDCQSIPKWSVYDSKRH